MSSKDLKKSAYLFDKIGFLNGRLKLGKTTVNGDLKVRSHAVFETGLVDKNLTTVSTDSKYDAYALHAPGDAPDQQILYCIRQQMI